MRVSPAHTANLSRPGSRLEPRLGTSSSAEDALTGYSGEAGGRIHDLLPRPPAQGQTHTFQARLSERPLLDAQA